jgi:carboxyl-terminal processing protease
MVGSKSAGAVLVSLMVPLPDDYQLQYPISDYVTMHGVRLEGTGISPDAEAPFPRYNERDTAIDKALALLHREELRDARFGKDANNN